MPRLPKTTIPVQSTASVTAAARTVSKSEAIRQALAAGLDKPGDALPWIREKYGLTMSPQHFLTIRSRSRQQRNSTPADVLTTIETIKPLVSRHGVDAVKRIVELCS